jgi:hypothetical protein
MSSPIDGHADERNQRERAHGRLVHARQVGSRPAFSGVLRHMRERSAWMRRGHVA